MVHRLIHAGRKCSAFRRIANKNDLPGSHEKPLPAKHKGTPLMGVDQIATTAGRIGKYARGVKDQEQPAFAGEQQLIAGVA
jgi:hypothetical protein